MKDEADSFVLDRKEVNPKVAERTSQKYLVQYCQAMSLEDLSKLEFTKKELLQQIKQYLLYSESADQSQNLQIRVVRFTKRYECIQLQAKLGKFIFPNISLININLESPIHSNRKIGRGGFSQIYSYKHSHNPQIVKCYPRKKWGVSQNILSMILNEYCLLKIASALEVGPKMKDFQGFDIIAYKDCFQFRMEHCNDPCEKASIDLQLLSDQLKENLLRLHAFSFIHNDIKVDNIAFSPFFNRYVFIDFNLSRIIREGIGFKTLTAFRGTPNYCSSQMRAIYQLQETRFVDLFYNDIIGLKESLICLQEKFKRNLCNNQFQSYFQEKSIIFAEQMTPQMCFTQLIFYIFRQDLNSIKYFDINPLSQRILGQIFTFLSLQPLNLKNRAIKKLLFRKRKNTQNYDKYGQENTNFNQSDWRVKITLKMLLSVNKDDVSEYYINQLRLQRKQEILELFANKNTNITDIISLIDYMHIIAKAIQINSSPFTLQQAQQLCHKAITTLIKDDRATINLETDFLDDYLAYSLKNRLEGKYLKIFQEALVNVIVCKVVPISRINTIYEEILSMKLSFQNKVLLLLKIKNSILWQIKQNSIIDNDCLFSTQNQLEKKMLNGVLQQKSINEKQCFILKIILNDDEYFNFHEISSQCNDFGPTLINQLIIYELTKSFRLLSQTNERNVSLLVECLQKRYQYDFTSFDRYQFILIKIIMLEQDHTKLQKIYESYDNTFKFRREKGYKKLLKFYLEDKFEWQISKAKLQKRIKYLQEILPQVSNYEHMYLFKFVFLALRVHYDKIKTQCKEMIQEFYHFLTKLLSSFTIDNFIQNNIDPLNTIIEKLTFNEYFSRKGLKSDKYVYSRSHCYQDYMKIDLNALEYSQKCPILVNKLLALSKILYFFNKTYQTMYVLTKLIRVHKQKPEKLQYILQFIFFKIFYGTNNFQSSSFLTNCKLIYDQIVQKKEEQSIYLLKNILFDEILMVLYRSNQERCAQLIKKMCNLVCLYPTHKNIRVYCDSIERFFEGNYFRQNFKMFYERLISSIDMNENPFYFIITYNGFKNIMIGDINTIYRQFVKCVPFFPIQLQGMFLSYLNIIYIDENSLNIRKKSFLYRQAIRFRFFSITLRKILRLFINEQSLLLMKLKKNHQKYVSLKNKMRTFLINPIRNMFKVFQNFACRWNKIYYSDLDTYKQAK